MTQQSEADSSEFARIASAFAHNFSNVLAVISGNVQIAHNALPDGKAKSLLSEANLGCELAARMTHQILAYSKAQRLHPAPININAVLRAMQPALKAMAGGKISVTLRLAKTLPLVFIDQSELEAAVVNLAKNAIDAMAGALPGKVCSGFPTRSATKQKPRVVRQFHLNPNDPRVGGLVITTQTIEDASRGVYVSAGFADTGCGMDEHVLARACEPFFTTKDAGLGTGLGLATVNGFLRQSGGRLDIESYPGRGTTVRIILPVAR